jgi:hypothetical protein
LIVNNQLSESQEKIFTGEKRREPPHLFVNKFIIAIGMPAGTAEVFLAEPLLLLNFVLLSVEVPGRFERKTINLPHWEAENPYRMDSYKVGKWSFVKFSAQ